jgi:transposase InsO family protein
MKIRPWVSWKNQTLVKKTGSVYTSPTNKQKIKEAKSCRSIHGLSVGSRHCSNERLHGQQQRVRFILLVIDFFSRYVWTKPLQSAKGSEMVDALRSILAMGRNPMTLFTDKGKEYCNSNVRNVLKQRGIDNFAS